MISKERLWQLARLSLIPAALVIIFFSGILPFEDYLRLVPTGNLTASVVPAEVASLTNAERTKDSLPTLAVNPLLTQAAQLKAEDMAKNSYYAHESPDGKSPLYWLDLVGYKYLNAGENLVIDRTTSVQAVDAWMNSPDHRENILRPQFTEIGVGVASGRFQGQDTIYVVEEFGTPYPSSASVNRTIAVATKPAPVPTRKTTQKIVATTSESVTSVVTVAPTTTKSVSTELHTIVTPIVRSITKPLQLIAPAESTPEVATTTAASSPVASTTLVYTLAPAFYAPVSLTEDARASNTRVMPVEGQEYRPNILVRVKAYIRRIGLAIPRLWY